MEQVEALLREHREGLSRRGLESAEHPDGTRWVTVTAAVLGKALTRMLDDGLLEVDRRGGSAGNLHRLTEVALAAPVVVVDLSEVLKRS